MVAIYTYLIGWLAGGVLLAGDLLLRGTARPAPGEPLPAKDDALPLATAVDSPSPVAAWGLLGMALTALGGTGLGLEAFGLLDGARRPVAAAAAGLVTAAAGLFVARRGA